MSMDVSRLGIEVESKGITEARNALAGANGKGGLANAADKAEKSVTKLTDSIGKLLSTNTSATTSAWAQSLTQLTQTLVGVQGSMAAVVNGLNQLTPAMQNAQNATNQAATANERKVKTGNVVTNTLKAMTTAAAAYAAVNFALSIVKQADAWQMMTARLQNATGSLNNAKVAQDQMFEISQKLRVPLEDQVKLYTRMAPAMQRLGKSGEDTKNVVEGIATALQLGGANGAEMSSVMLQLSQSFGSGVLNGAEFNAVAENGQVIMKALMDFTGKNQAQLKKMGSEGKLSIATVNAAIEKALPEWRKKFENLPVTFEGGMQRIKNAWTKAIGEMGQDTKFNQELAKSLKTIEDMVPAVARELGQAFVKVLAFVKENSDKLGQIWDQIKGITSDVWKLAEAFVGLTGKIIGAGDEISVIGLLIYTVRAGLAATVDVVKYIGAAFVHVGTDIAAFFLKPVQMGIELGEALYRTVAYIMKQIAIGAEALGWTTMAEGAKKAAAQMEQSAHVAEGMAGALDDIISKGRKIGDSLEEGFKTGNTELHKFLTGVDEVSKAVEETAKRTMNAKDWNASKNVAKSEDAKGIQAEKTAAKAYEDVMEGLNAKFREQLELRNRLDKFGSDYEKLGPNQKKVIELEEHLARLQKTGASEKVKQYVEEELELARVTARLEQHNTQILETIKADSALEEKSKTRINSLKEEADAMDRKVATYGMAKGAIEEMELASAKAALWIAETDVDRTPHQQKMIELLEEEIKVRERLAASSGALGQLETETEFEKLLDPKKAEKFGNALADGFGKAGSAMGKLVNSFDKYDARMSKVKKAWDLVNKETDPMKRAKMAEKATDLETESRLASYADMAGAAKQFFDEGTQGYKAMETAEKAFRVLQLAMQVKSFLQEMGFIQTTVAKKVTGEAIKTGAVVTGQATETAAVTAGEMARNIAKIPGVFMSFMSALGPWGMAAAGVAIAAVLGIAAGGASAGGKAPNVPLNSGTGTVFGDSSAQSESIANSIDILKDVDTMTMKYSAQMLASLRNIESSLVGVTGQILRNGGVMTGEGFQGTMSSSGDKIAALHEKIAYSNPLNKLINSVGLDFGTGFASAAIKGLMGSTKTTLADAGLQFGVKSLADTLSTGVAANSYQTINTEKKSLFGLVKSSGSSTSYGDIDSNLSNQFTNLVKDTFNGVVAATEALGVSADVTKSKLANFTVELGRISLKDLTGAQIQERLTAVFGALADKMAQAAESRLVDFQKAGEGYFETLVRVASGVETASVELDKLGITAIAFTDIVNKGGDVATEIVRQSIVMKEAGTSVGEIIRTLDADAASLADTYGQLLSVRTSLKAFGIAPDVTRDLLRAAGGLEALQDALASYTENFFTDAEQNGIKLTALRSEFAKLNLAVPASKEAFKTLVQQLSSTGAVGQELATKVLMLSGAFAEVADFFDEAYQEKLSTARDNLSSAYERESEALQTTRDRFVEFTSSLAEFRKSLMTGDLSPLSVADKYAVEKSNFESVLSKAKAGDVDAVGKFEEASRAFLEASKANNASSAVFLNDFERVMAEALNLQSVSGAGATEAEKQLAALDKQVEGLITVNQSVLSVTAAINALTALIASGATSLATAVVAPVDGSHAGGLDFVPFNGYTAELHKGEGILTASENRAYQSMDYSQYGRGGSEALVNEIKALREQVAALRDGQREQTGQLVAAQYDSSERNANAIVDGQKDAAQSSTYSEKAKVTLA